MNVIDGGDSGCGELLMRMRREIRDYQDGTPIRIVTADPGARDDIPIWCRMLGHEFQRAIVHDDGRPAFDSFYTAR